MRGVVDSLISVFATIAFAALTMLFYPSWVWSLAVLVPTTIFYEIILRSPSATAYIIAKRTKAVGITAIVILALGGLTYYLAGVWQWSSVVSSGSLQQPSISNSDMVIIVGFCLLGIVLGILFRQALGRSVFSTLLQKLSVGQRITTIGIWTTILIVAPYPIHPKAVPFYVWGVALGVLIHKAVHLWLSRKVQGFRRIANIYHAWPPEAELTTLEHDVLKLFKRLRFRKLRKKLDGSKQRVESGSDSSLRLALISASLFRIKGNYEAAIREVTEVVPRGPVVIDSPVKVHLYLMRAICQRDANQDKEARQTIDSLLATKEGQSCPLVQATDSLLQSEEVLKDPSNFQPSVDPLDAAHKSMRNRSSLMKLREGMIAIGYPDQLKDFFSRFLDYCVPVTAPFLLDVLGYALLSAGYTYEASVFFHECITVDPTYTAAYLHLGDYFHVKQTMTTSDSIKANCIWNAKLCYYAAKYSEKVGRSRIFQIASKRLDDLERRYRIQPVARVSDGQQEPS